MLTVFGCQADNEGMFWTNIMLNERFSQQQQGSDLKTDPAIVIRFIFELAFATSDVRSDVGFFCLFFYYKKCNITCN
jgi:hypothetical protein